ncbi:hypothetical protein AVEN_159601-1 [Araneus ventricosus]|uniref:Uncharacterized protein n=1 Tax=Araneus ventricosus TaxID=182803 RepID=A0A4Y2VWK3_ARAVE|nr:hypothetical protein AVEN_159601-1 [Araneus ventricosus]
MACFVSCVDFVTGPEPMEVDDVSNDEEMEWEEAFLPPQVAPSFPLETATPVSARVSSPETEEPDNVRRKKKPCAGFKIKLSMSDRIMSINFRTIIKKTSEKLPFDKLETYSG